MISGETEGSCGPGPPRGQVHLHPFTQHLPGHRVTPPFSTLPCLPSPLLPSPSPGPIQAPGGAFALDLTHDPQDSVSLLYDFAHEHLICGDRQGPVTFLTLPGPGTQVAAEGLSREATRCQAGPGCLVLPKAKAGKFQEALQFFQRASTWLQRRARRPDKSRSER